MIKIKQFEEIKKEPWEMSNEDLKIKYPKIKEKYIDYIAGIEQGKGYNELTPQGAYLKVSNEYVLIHEIGHIVANDINEIDFEEWHEFIRQILPKGVQDIKPIGLLKTELQKREQSLEDFVDVWAYYQIIENNVGGIYRTIANKFFAKYPEVIDYLKIWNY